MPRNDLTQLSATDAENTDVKGVSIAEGMAPSGVNNAIRAVAAMLADAFAAAAPGTKLTAVKAANVIVADTTDRLTIGTTSPTLVSHDNSTTTTTIDAERNLTLEVGTTGTQAAFKVDGHDSTAKRTLIDVALAQTGGRRQDAARLLGWGRNTLTRKIKELGMGGV